VIEFRGTSQWGGRYQIIILPLPQAHGLTWIRSCQEQSDGSGLGVRSIAVRKGKVYLGCEARASVEYYHPNVGQ